MRILGIDPGLGATGYAIIESKNGPVKFIEAGFIKTFPNLALPERLQKLHGGVDGLLHEYKPSVLVLEKLYSHYRHPTTAILMGHARGVICLLCGIHKVKLVNYPSTKVKKSITGNGRATKEQVQRMVQSLLSIKRLPESTDLSDALALALSHLYIDKKRVLMA